MIMQTGLFLWASIVLIGTFSKINILFLKQKNKLARFVASVFLVPVIGIILLILGLIGGSILSPILWFFTK